MPSPEGGWAPADGEVLSVSDLLGLARGLLEEALAWVWVEGEVSNLRVPASGHAYFTLGDGSAQLRAVCFRSTLRLLGAGLAEGLHVLARGRVTLYEARGDLQLIVEDLEPQGAGLARLELEALKRRLAAEGLFDEARKRALPLLPRAVGVVTSPTGAALADVLRVLERRAPGVSVALAPARVQGPEAARELREALGLVAGHRGVDVVILGRGGGSREDLSAFNDEALVRAVARCPVPVISAVGHEIDVTLSDLAADLRASTPSAAAELAVREWSRWLDEVRRAEAALRGALVSRQRGWAAAVERLALRLPSPAARIARLRITVDRRVETLAAPAQAALRQARSGLGRLEERLARAAPAERLGRASETLGRLEERLAAAAARHRERRRGRVAALAATLEVLGPRAVLARGYAIARAADGRVLRDAARCAAGDRIEVLLARGTLDARVEEVTGAVDGEETPWSS